jgi:hypothetical protein
MNFIFLILLCEGMIGFSVGCAFTLIEDDNILKDIVKSVRSQYENLTWFGHILYSLLLIIIFPIFLFITIGNLLVRLVEILINLCIKNKI